MAEPDDADPAEIRLVPPGRLLHLARHSGARRAWWIGRNHPERRPRNRNQVESHAFGDLLGQVLKGSAHSWVASGTRALVRSGAAPHPGAPRRPARPFGRQLPGGPPGGAAGGAWHPPQALAARGPGGHLRLLRHGLRLVHRAAQRAAPPGGQVQVPRVWRCGLRRLQPTEEGLATGH